MKYTDAQLKDLQTRVLFAQSNGIQLAGALDHLAVVLSEVLAHRAAACCQEEPKETAPPKGPAKKDPEPLAQEEVKPLPVKVEEPIQPLAEGSTIEEAPKPPSTDESTAEEVKSEEPVKLPEEVKGKHKRK